MKSIGLVALCVNWIKGLTKAARGRKAYLCLLLEGSTPHGQGIMTRAGRITSTFRRHGEIMWLPKRPLLFDQDTDQWNAAPLVRGGLSINNLGNFPQTCPDFCFHVIKNLVKLTRLIIRTVNRKHRILTLFTLKCYQPMSLNIMPLLGTSIVFKFTIYYEK